MNYAARTMLSSFSFNIGWWACAMGASHGYPWFGPALLPLWVGLHLYYSPVPKGEALFLILVGIAGFIIDTALIRAGLFAISPTARFAPLWLVVIWVLFGQSFESMLMLRRKKLLLCLIGGLSGPLSYYFFEALNILNYARPLWLSLVLHGILWAILTPAFFVVRDWALTLYLEPTAAPIPAVEFHEAPLVLPYSAARPSDPDKP